MEPNKRIIVAVDTSSIVQAGRIVAETAPFVGGFKLGLQFIMSMFRRAMLGDPEATGGEDIKFLPDLLAKMEGKLFLDLKLADIPNTVGEAAKEIAALNPFALNVHASCGIESMMAVVKNKGNALVWAVTVLTSFEENNGNLTFGGPTKAKVMQFAREAKLSGVDGIICSPQELEVLVKRPELKGLEFATPGIRPSWAETGDQKRITTPLDALKAGATRIIIGRPITDPPKEVGSSVNAVERIVEEIQGVS